MFIWLRRIRRMLKIPSYKNTIRQKQRKRKFEKNASVRHLSSGAGNSRVERETSDVTLYLAMATLIDQILI